MKLSARLGIIVSCAVVGLIIVGGMGLYGLHRSLLAERHAQLTTLLNLSNGMVDHFYKMEQAGTLSHEDAQKQAASALMGLQSGSDYIFARDDHDVMVAHPTASRVGKVDPGSKLPNGMTTAEAYRDALSKQGKIAFVEILTAKPGGDKDTLLPKLNGVIHFDPWGWVIGTGFFTDDLTDAFLSYAISTAIAGLLVLTITSLISFWFAKRIYAQLGGEPEYAAKMVNAVAQGNLSLALKPAQPGSLIHALGQMQSNMKTLISNIHNQSESLKHAATAIQSTITQISSASMQSSEATAATAASVEEMAVSVGMIADSARDTETHSRNAAELASNGEKQIGDTTTEIQKASSQIKDASHQISALADRNRQISIIANVIKEIADQTNLLALNAAIEAARAGEQGRGFAVVADEVRKLAERTGKATNEINNTIQVIQADTNTVVASMHAVVPQMEHSAALAELAAQSLHEISISTEATLEKIHDVAHATSEQNDASNNIAINVERIARMVDDSDQAVRGATESVASLSRMANDINAALSRFQL